MADQVGEKTEKPSAKRLKEARERGQVAISRDVSMALGSLAATGVLVGAGSFLLRRLTATITDGLSHFGDAPLREMSGEDLIPLVISGGTLVAVDCRSGRDRRGGLRRLQFRPSERIQFVDRDR